MRLNHHTAVITGAGSGIGRAITLAFAAEGANIAALDFNGDALTNTVACLPDGKGIARVVNVADLQAVNDAIKDAADAFGGIDTVVNCAGILSSTPFDDLTEAEWDRVLAVNLKGTFLVCQAAMPYLRKSTCGSVINIASNAGRDGGVKSSMAYAASKAGVIGLTRGLAKHEAVNGVTCNIIAPGPTNSDMFRSFSPADIAALKETLPVGRLCEPKEIAELAVFVASPEARSMTGAVLDINGGLFIG